MFQRLDFESCQRSVLLGPRQSKHQEFKFERAADVLSDDDLGAKKDARQVGKLARHVDKAEAASQT